MAQTFAESHWKKSFTGQKKNFSQVFPLRIQKLAESFTRS